MWHCRLRLHCGIAERKIQRRDKNESRRRHTMIRKPTLRNRMTLPSTILSCKGVLLGDHATFSCEGCALPSTVLLLSSVFSGCLAKILLSPANPEHHNLQFQYSLSHLFCFPFSASLYFFSLFSPSLLQPLLSPRHYRSIVSYTLPHCSPSRSA